MIGLFIPVYNNSSYVEAQVRAILCQTLTASRIVVADSSDKPLNLDPYLDAGAKIVRVDNGAFDHGLTRNLVLTYCSDCSLIVFLTQDALPADEHSFEKLVGAFSDKKIAAAYGRQLSSEDNGFIARHARHYNYGPSPLVKSQDDIPSLGLRAAFLSNSFAAYRLSAFREMGGFSSPIIMGEDMELAARFLHSGHKIAYVPDARVFHCHDYSMKDEFRRYFDTGVFHHDHQWLLETFGRAEGEGRRFVFSELRYLLEHAPGRIPEALLRTVLKYLGYRLGRHYDSLPRRILPRLSMNRNYWKA